MPVKAGVSAMKSFKTIKRIIILVVGGTVLTLGVALVVLPGPAFIVIPVGLAILAVEFAWARRWMRQLNGLLQRARGIESADHGVKAARAGPAAGTQ